MFNSGQFRSQNEPKRTVIHIFLPFLGEQPLPELARLLLSS
jgi:hypothetical protein